MDDQQEPYEVGDLVEVKDLKSPFYQWTGVVKSVWPTGEVDEVAHYRVEAHFIDSSQSLPLWFGHGQLVEQDIPF